MNEDMKPGYTGGRGTRLPLRATPQGKHITHRQQHAPKTPNESSGKRGGRGELTKGPAALPAVRAHLEVQAMSWEGEDTGRMLTYGKPRGRGQLPGATRKMMQL